MHFVFSKALFDVRDKGINEVVPTFRFGYDVFLTWASHIRLPPIMSGNGSAHAVRMKGRRNQPFCFQLSRTLAESDQLIG